MNIIEIEDDQIKFSSVEFKENKFFVLKLGVFKKPLEDKEKKDIAKAFVHSSDKIVVSIPRRKVSMHYHSFPSQRIDELQKMAHFQALKQFPYKDLSVIYDLRVLLKEANGYTKVNLSVVAENILNKYIDDVKGVISPDRVTVNSVGVVGFYRLLKNEKEKILIEIGNNYSNLCIISEGELFFSREISRGYYSIRDDGIKLWLDEVLHSLDSFNKEGLIPKIDSVAILGPKHLKSLEDIKEQLPFSSIEFIYQEDFIKKEDNFEFFSQNRNEIYSLIKLLGLSYYDERLSIDLTPPLLLQQSLKKNISSGRRRAAIYFGAAALVLITTFGVLYKRKVAHVNNIKSFLSSIESSANTLSERKEITGVFIRKSAQRLFLDIFSEIAVILPDKVRLNRFEYKKDSEIIIEGVSPDSESVYQFYEEIKKMKNVESINSFKTSISSDTEVIFYLKIVLL